MAGQRDYYGKTTAERKTLDDANSLVESAGAPVLRKLIDDPRRFTQDDWEVLSFLIANFYVRMPSTIEWMRTSLVDLYTQANEKAEMMKVSLQQALSEGSDLSEFPQVLPNDESPSMTLNEMNEVSAKLKAEEGDLVAAEITFDSSIDLAKIIQRMRVVVLKAPKDLFFVTSDRPLVLRSQRTGSPRGAGWANSDVQATIALHPGRYLFITHADTPGIEIPLQATPKVVEEVNLATIIFADQEVYSPSKYSEADDWMKGAGHWNKRK